MTAGRAGSGYAWTLPEEQARACLIYGLTTAGLMPVLPRFTSYSAFHAIKKHYCRFIPCNGRIQRINSLELHKPCGHQIASYGTIVLDLLYVPFTGVKLPAYRSEDAPAAEALQVQGLLRFAKRPEAS